MIRRQLVLVSAVLLSGALLTVAAPTASATASSSATSCVEVPYIHHGTKLVWRWRIRHHRRVRVKVRVRYAKTEHRSECTAAVLDVSVMQEWQPVDEWGTPLYGWALDNLGAGLAANGYVPPTGDVTMTVTVLGGVVCPMISEAQLKPVPSCLAGETGLGDTGPVCSATVSSDLLQGLGCFFVEATGADLMVTFNFADGSSVSTTVYVPPVVDETPTVIATASSGT